MYDKQNEKRENQMQFKGPAADFFKQNPDLLASIQNRIQQRGGQLKDLKERMGFLNERMKLLKGQAELYTSAGMQMPPTIMEDISNLHNSMNKVSSEYERVYTNVNPIDIPDTDDTVVDLNGEEVAVNKEILDLAKAGDPNVLKALDDLQQSGDEQSVKEAKAIAKLVGDQFFSQEQEQTRFKDNGETEIVQSTNSPVAIPPVASAPTNQDVTSKNSSIVDGIKDALFNSGTKASGAPGAAMQAGAKLMGNLKRSKGN